MRIVDISGPHNAIPLAQRRRPAATHLRNGTLCLIGVCAVAVVGYTSSGWSFSDAAYMAVITVFTVGYGETVPVDTPGRRLFTMLFVVFGCTSYLYIGGALVQFLVEGQIETALGNRRRSKSIQSLAGHTIICGFGRVGRVIASDLHRAGHPFIVLDRDPRLAVSIKDEGYLGLEAMPRARRRCSTPGSRERARSRSCSPMMPPTCSSP